MVKTKAIIFIIGALILAGSFAIFYTKGPNLGAVAVVNVRYDREFNTFLTDVQKFQNRYMATHGVYFQGLAPLNGTPKLETAAVWTRKPKDQAQSWNDVFPTRPTKLPFNVWIDVYGGSKPYYIVYFKANVNGVLYSRNDTFGSITKVGTWNTRIATTS